MEGGVETDHTSGLPSDLRESSVERQIREAIERGDFDDLPGAGKPIEGIGVIYDPAWWAKGYVLRERARDRADEVRRAIRDELPRLRAAAADDEVRDRVAELNRMVDAVNEHLTGLDRVRRVEL